MITTDEKETDTSPILEPDQLAHLVGLIQDDVTLNRARYQEVHDRLIKIVASHERLRTRWRRAQDAHLGALRDASAIRRAYDTLKIRTEG